MAQVTEAAEHQGVNTISLEESWIKLLRLAAMLRGFTNLS